jgi:hypothetical protein
MNITSRQKKTVLPLIVFLASTAFYFCLIGSFLALLAVPFMAITGGILGGQAVPAITAWFNRDGWKYK